MFKSLLSLKRGKHIKVPHYWPFVGKPKINIFHHKGRIMQNTFPCHNSTMNETLHKQHRPNIWLSLIVCWLLYIKRWIVDPCFVFSGYTGHPSKAHLTSQFKIQCPVLDVWWLTIYHLFLIPVSYILQIRGNQCDVILSFILIVLHWFICWLHLLHLY